MNRKAELGGRRAALALGGILFLFFVASSLAQASIPTKGGIWRSDESSYKLSEERLNELVLSLRRITGLRELDFNPDGSLILGDHSTISSGSPVARQLLHCVLGGGDVFIIEDHSNSPSVNFGQLDEGLKYEDAMAERQMDIWRIRIDFDDFRQMDAPRDVRETFDVGFTTLHELLHGLGLKDTHRDEEVGECEEVVNKARAELGLPLREHYLGQMLRLSQHHVSVRLRFRSSDASKRRTKARYLFFLLPWEDSGSKQRQ